MKRLLLIKCPQCGRIRRFGEWRQLDEMPEKEKLSQLILADGCDYSFMRCSYCSPPEEDATPTR